MTHNVYTAGMYVTKTVVYCMSSSGLCVMTYNTCQPGKSVTTPERGIPTNNRQASGLRKRNSCDRKDLREMPDNTRTLSLPFQR
jgi:hypothetical protein